MSLELSGVSVCYGTRVAVDSVSLTARAGEVLVLLGPNGSGKSSLLRAIAGLVPSRGHVQCREALRAAYMPQDNAIRAGLSVFETVLLGRIRSLSFRPARRDLVAAAAVLGELGVADLAFRPINELSGGQRQLVFLAQVLAADPQVLLLDEPTSSLDLAHQLHVLEHLRAATRRRGLTSIVAMHDLNLTCRFADRVAVMQAGRIAAIGMPADIVSAPLISAVFGVEATILSGPDGLPVVIATRATSTGGVDRNTTSTVCVPSL